MASWSCSDIKALRLRLGWSQAQLAARLGCDAKLIATWETQQATQDKEAIRQLEHLRVLCEVNSFRTKQQTQADKLLQDENLSKVDLSLLPDKKA